MREPLRSGEQVLLADSRGRTYLVTLAESGEFHTHAGVTPHASMIGHDEGLTVRSGSGARFVVVRPTLAEYVLNMPRGAQVVYPKDLGPLLVLADLFVGARVFEAGVGSGAVSMALLRAGAEVVGYELRPDFGAIAQKNVTRFLGADVAYTVEERDAYAGIDIADLDRVVLDLPEPWRVVTHAETALRPGGILVAYLPTIGQVAQLREALDASAFGMARTIEVLERSWHVQGQSVRPDHRMVAHTGFLTAARLLAGAGGGTGGESVAGKEEPASS